MELVAVAAGPGALVVALREPGPPTPVGLSVWSPGMPIIAIICMWFEEAVARGSKWGADMV